MSILGGIGTIAGGIFGGPAGAAAGGAIGGGLDQIFGGGSSSSSSSSGSGSGSYSLSPEQYAYIAQQLAIANTPLTLATQRYGNLLGAELGNLGILSNLAGTSSASVLKDAFTRGQLATQLRGRELDTLRDLGQQLAYQEGQTRLGIAAMSPQFYGLAGEKMLSGEESLGRAIGNTNLALKANEQQAKIDIAKQQNVDLGKAMNTRAQAEGNLALGSQRIAGNLAQLEGQTISGLTLNKARTQSDLARIRGNIEGQKELRRYGAELAMSGQRSFA